MSTLTTEELFADYLDRVEAGEELDFESWVRAHSEREPELRGMLEGHRLLDVHFGAEGVDPELVQRLARLAARRSSSSRYKVQGELARGGMGAILRVWDEDLKRNLAMKVVLDADQAPTKDRKRMLARFLEEADVTGQLDHPGIVPVHELGLDARGRAYFTMKLVKGQTLREILGLVHDGKEGWTQTRALGVILKVCEAMSYAHAKGVIHRDLKPGNVMVGRYGEVYVMDWGLARVLGREERRDIRIRPAEQAPESEIHTARADRLASDPESPLYTMDGDVVGTPAYMAPEQAAGRIEAMGPHSDVYAVGAMLYHLMTGEPPYVPKGARVNNYAVLQRVLEGPPRSLDRLASKAPAELAAICEKAMTREVPGRYADMSGLAGDLRAYLDGRVVRAHRTGALVELRKWAARNKGAAAAVALTAILVAGFALFTMREQARAEEERLDLDHPLAQWLQDQAKELWPALPETAPALRRWVEYHEDLQSRLDDHRFRWADSQKAVRGTAVNELGFDLLYSVEREQALVERLESFTRPETGLAEIVRDWLEFAETIEEQTLTGPDARHRWQEAIAAIRASPLYHGLEIQPVLGFRPIGPDPHSGLLEFVHLRSGKEPNREPRTDELILDEAMGIVFVLIPGGDDVKPFYLSKYEITRAQWKRLVEGVREAPKEWGSGEELLRIRNGITYPLTST